jgi:hypothetical protein
MSAANALGMCGESVRYQVQTRQDRVSKSVIRQFRFFALIEKRTARLARRIGDGCGLGSPHPDLVNR